MPSSRPFSALVLLVLALLSVTQNLSAEVSLNESRTWMRARVIAPGQQVWSFESAYQSYKNRFSGRGELVPLGDRYARAVTWKQLLDNSTVQGRAEIESYMRPRGISPSDVAANATYKVERNEVGMAVNWAYGLSRGWMIGFQVPLVYRQTRVATSIDLTPGLVAGAGQNRTSLLSLSSDNLRARISSMAEQELANSGYDSVPDQKGSWDWGDISLLSQFSLMENYRWTWSLQQSVRVPTARNPSLSDYLQTDGDDGQVDLGLTSLVDYRIRRFTNGFRIGYVAQLPDTLRMRVSSDRYQVDPSVRRDLGDWIWASVDSEYRITSRWTANLEYAFLTKSRDRYHGTSSNGIAYDTLGENSDQELHQSRAGFQYRFGTRSTRSGVENKWVASVGYTYPWIGRNSIDASRGSVELISYF